MATLYNQYIYKNGAWMKIGTSSDSVTYTLSYSALTGLLTLTGSDGSTSTVTIESGSSDAITGITVNGTTVTVTDGVAAISIPTNVSAFTNDAGYLTTHQDISGKVDTQHTFSEGTGAIQYNSEEDAVILYRYSAEVGGSSVELYTSSVGLSWGNNDDSNYNGSSLSIDSTGITILSTEGVKIRNVATPTNTTDAVNKQYVDNLIPTVPTNVSAFTNDAGYLTSYTETDPVFSASAAAGITATDISNWNNKVSDDKTWNGIELVKTVSSLSNTQAIVPFLWNINETTARYATVSKIPAYDCIAQYSNGYLNSTTPSSDDSSTKVATTAFIQTALSALTADIPAQASISSTGLITYKNSGGTSLFTLQLPLYNGGVS